jgi:hypothetical protein
MKGPFRTSKQRCGFPRLKAAGILILALGALLWLQTAPVHAGTDEEIVAVNFLRFIGSDKAILSSEPLQVNLLDAALAPVTVGRLFHLAGGGYILVSGDRSISPVKAYSLEGDFAGLPEPYRLALLAELELRVRAAQEAAAGRAPLEAEASETGARWDFLLNFAAGARTPQSYTPGTWLLQSTWNQKAPYNKFLPQVGSDTVVAGCVNVAIGQVLRYHQYPAASQGVLSYTWTPSSGSPQTLKTVLYRGYNWDNMPMNLDGTTPSYQADEVALLIRDLGIANRTDFGVSGSGASVNTQVLVENFGYSTALAAMFNTNYPSFIAALQNDIQAERPVLLTFPGHMTVADGFQTDATGVSVHVNMGWGGQSNGFYYLDPAVNATIIASPYIFGVGAGQLQIHYNIKPCSGVAGDCHADREAGDGIAGTVMTGYFSDAKDTDRYEVYLKGPTTVAASRGSYSNVAFHVSLFNADSSEVFSIADPNTAPAGTPLDAGTLPAGRYGVRVSLCDTAGTWCFTQNSSLYTVTIASGAPTAEERTAIDQALEKAPVIGSVAPESPLASLLLNTGAGTRKLLIDARDENGDALALSLQNSNPAAMAASLGGSAGNVLFLNPTGVNKVSSRIAVTASAGGKSTTKEFTVLTDNQDTGFGKNTGFGGHFSSATEMDTHRAILDGACTIAGSRPGLSNQAFYLKVYDALGTLVASSNGSAGAGSKIEATFSRQVHTLTASLCSGGSCYGYSGGDLPYAIAVSCPGADESVATIANLLGIDLAGANLPYFKPGDVDGDGLVTLADVVLALQVLVGVDTAGKTIMLDRDVNSDGRIGLAEIVYVLQMLSGRRAP